MNSSCVLKKLPFIPFIAFLLLIMLVTLGFVHQGHGQCFLKQVEDIVGATQHCVD